MFSVVFNASKVTPAAIVLENPKERFLTILHKNHAIFRRLLLCLKERELGSLFTTNSMMRIYGRRYRRLGIISNSFENIFEGVVFRGNKQSFTEWERKAPCYAAALHGNTMVLQTDQAGKKFVLSRAFNKYIDLQVPNVLPSQQQTAASAPPPQHQIALNSRHFVRAEPNRLSIIETLTWDESPRANNHYANLSMEGTLLFALDKRSSMAVMAGTNTKDAYIWSWESLNGKTQPLKGGAYPRALAIQSGVVAKFESNKKLALFDIERNQLIMDKTSSFVTADYPSIRMIGHTTCVLAETCKEDPVVEIWDVRTKKESMQLFVSEHESIEHFDIQGVVMAAAIPNGSNNLDVRFFDCRYIQKAFNQFSMPTTLPLTLFQLSEASLWTVTLDGVVTERKFSY